MEFHLERGLRLHAEPEHKSLYSWAIQEIDAQGRQIGHASDAESGDDDEHHTFENDGKDCSVTITETRTKATPGFWIKLSFSLTDIDPDDIRVNDLSNPSTLGNSQIPGIPGRFAVGFHTTNYIKKIFNTSSQSAEPIPTSDYIYFTNDWFAPKFAKAFAHAARLCGAKRSAF
jgi:hypothetical protein